MKESIKLAAFAVLMLATLPVTFPIAMLQLSRLNKRKSQRAAKTICTQCAKPLGGGSVDRADLAVRARFAQMQKENPNMRMRMVQTVHAICECGAEYSYDEKLDVFSLAL